MRVVINNRDAVGFAAEVEAAAGAGKAARAAAAVRAAAPGGGRRPEQPERLDVMPAGDGSCTLARRWGHVLGVVQGFKGAAALRIHGGDAGSVIGLRIEAVGDGMAAGENFTGEGGRGGVIQAGKSNRRV